jgi:hypothetical protein
LGTFEQLIWYLDLIVMMGLLVRLILSGLFRTYLWFFSYLLASFLESVVLVIVPYSTDAWAKIYMAGQSIKVILSVLVVLELFKLALVSQPALAAFGRKAAVYVSAFALIAAALGLAIDRSVPHGQSPILHRFFVMQRTLDFSVAIFLLVIAWFVMWFPVQVKSNVAVYTLGFVVYFLADLFSLLAQNLLPFRFIGYANTGMLCFSFLCLTAWLLGIRREGEERTTVVGHGWNPAASADLTDQLRAINDALGRLARR